MVPLLAALIAIIPPAAAPKQVTIGHTAWIFSTVGQSEFCPPGNVAIDLRTGRYTLTERAPRRVCGEVDLERPVRKGTLVGDRLARLRAAYLRVVTEGFENAVCREGGKRQVIVINNGGTPILVVATGRGTGSAPDDLACWNEAATGLHDILDDTFGARGWR